MNDVDQESASVRQLTLAVCLLRFLRLGGGEKSYVTPLTPTALLHILLACYCTHFYALICIKSMRQTKLAASRGLHVITVAAGQVVTSREKRKPPTYDNKTQLLFTT